MKNYLLTLLLALCLSVPAFAEGNYIQGDVNGDGYVNPADISSLIDYLLNGTAIDEAAADVNGDGSVNPADISALIDYLLGVEVFTVNGVSFTMMPVEGGTFTMGATEEQGSDYDSDELPVHQVTLSSYSIGQTEVTQALWLAVMGTNPSTYTGNLQRPVEKVSWNDCQTFITRLNELTGKNFRLPTEAEWEFAARGGNKSQHYKYAGSNGIDAVAWYWDNIPSQSSGTAGYGTQSVATKAPNELGLYDMSGNVWEWCQDRYGSYSSAAQADPTGPESGSSRVGRGGSWIDDAGYCRVSCRYSDAPSYRYSDLGLRLALSDINHITAVPEITAEVCDDAVIITATGEGTVQLYVNGEAVDNPYTAMRGDEEYTVTACATAKGEGQLMSQSEEQTITIPALAPQTETFTVNGVSFTMIPVEGGTFTMGATAEQGSYAWPDESPTHQVTLSSYSIGQTEVTQALWLAVMGTNPSTYTGNLQRPVEKVSWNDCQTFITRLNELTGKNFRLPTEAEWEFAARGGNKSQHYKYAGSNDIDAVAWYWGNIPLQTTGTQPVATKAPNELGLYDMSGNVWEWCQDWWGSYSSAAQADPTGPETGSYRVYRGGSWDSDARDCRVSRRDSYSPSGRGSDLGLRLAL